MPIADYLTIGGLEILNSARTRAYIDAGFVTGGRSYDNCGACDSLDHILEQGPFTTPLEDGAPWIDVRNEASHDFAGIIPLGVRLSDDGAITRTTIPTLNGHRLGRTVCGPKRFTFGGLLVGASCCAVDAGLNWLRKALLGEDTNACNGTYMELLNCCPDCDRVPGYIDANCSGGTTLTRTRLACECLEDVIRCYKDVALESGPIVTQQIGGGCGACAGCPIVQVEWTMISARPYSYGKRSVVFIERLFPQPDPLTCDPKWSKDGVGTNECDDIEEDCDDQSNCPELEVPCGTIPPPPVPDDSLASCICDDPLSTVVDCFTVDAAAGVDIDCNSDLVPVLTIFAGAAMDLRSVTVRFYNDPLSLGCSGITNAAGKLINSCEACNTLHVTAIPAGSALEVDGEDEVTRLLCPGGVIEPADQVLYGANGGAFELPVLSCDPYVIVVTANAETVSPDSYVSLTLVERRV